MQFTKNSDRELITVVRHYSQYLFILLTGIVLALLILTVSLKAQVVEPATDSSAMVTVSAQGTILTASADNINDLDNNSWQYAWVHDEPVDCAVENYDQRAPSNQNKAVTLTDHDLDHWICFKVQDQAGNAYYGSYHIIEIQTIAEPEEVVTIAEIPETEEETQASISIIQTDRSLVANIENIDDEVNVSWQAVLLKEGDQCNQDNDGIFDNEEYQPFPISSVNGLTWRDNGKNYCFKATLSGAAPAILYAQATVSDIPGTPATTASDVEEKSNSQQTPDSQSEDASDSQEIEMEYDQQPDSQSDESNHVTQTDYDKDNQRDKTEKEEEDNLQGLAVGIVVLGVIAVIAVILIYRRPEVDDEDDDTQDSQPEPEDDEDEEEEEVKPKKKKQASKSSKSHGQRKSKK